MDPILRMWSSKVDLYAKVLSSWAKGMRCCSCMPCEGRAWPKGRLREGLTIRL